MAAPKAETLAPGTVVTLRRGGLPMTVEKLYPDDQVGCVWFGMDKQICKETFQLAALRATTEGDIDG